MYTEREGREFGLFLPQSAAGVPPDLEGIVITRPAKGRVMVPGQPADRFRRYLIEKPRYREARKGYPSRPSRSFRISANHLGISPLSSHVIWCWCNWHAPVSQ